MHFFQCSETGIRPCCKVEALVNHEVEAFENHEAEARLPKI